jgi:dTDP-4-dehydrorhamnose 3,5-epimerase
MIFKETLIKGIFELQPKVFKDKRGWYSPIFEKETFKKKTRVDFETVQMATSLNKNKGTLRGFHYQINKPQGKLVWVSLGAILDVGLDVRKGSQTFGKHVAVLLTATNHKQLWLPPGIAHGYITIKENTQVNYLVTSGSFSPENERGVNAFDNKLSIDWKTPKSKILIKDRDLNFPKLDDIPKEELL